MRVKAKSACFNKLYQRDTDGEMEMTYSLRDQLTLHCMALGRAFYFRIDSTEQVYLGKKRALWEFMGDHRSIQCHIQ
jgi:hypothetical protein